MAVAPPVRLAAARRRGARTAAVMTAAACALAACALAGSALAGCSAQVPSAVQVPPAPAGSSSGSRSGSTRPASQPAWMLTRAALSELSTDPAIRAGLARSRVYEILRGGQQPPAAARGLPVVTFSAVSALRQAVTGHQLPAGTRAVLYDPEAWPATPAAEQRHPVGAARRALGIARAHGLRLIVAPALNLTTVRPGSPGPRWRQFLSWNLAGAIARICDVIDLQAQSLERDTGTYAAFVRAATAQARAANPRVIVMAGLSTNPPGAAVTSRQLTAAIRATRRVVGGYWLNIPGRGSRCPACHAPRPDIGREAMRPFL